MGRNKFTKDGWTLESVLDLSVCSSFDCGNDDINDYFRVDALWHREELLSQTYCLYQDTEPDLHLAFLDFCNDALKMQYPFTGVDQKIHYSFLPAVKLTRLGVLNQLRGSNIGTHALNMVKQFFTTANRTGCRFITVDANSEPRVIKFYEKNGFSLLTNKDANRDQRAMYFDLKRFKNIRKW